MMRQVLITRAGPPDVLRVSDGPDKTPGPGEVRIRVEAIGVNFADVVGRLGMYADGPKIPYVPGYEITGRVDALGKGVDPALADQPVIAMTQFGGYADQLCVPVAQVFPRPAAMSAEIAAGFTVAYLTAYEALVVLGGIRQNDRVLIHAAAGGVGLAAVNIARLHDAIIYGTASPQKHAFLRECGVQPPIDYRSRDFAQEVDRLTEGRGVQIALDPLGGRSWAKSYRSLSPGGRLILSGVFGLTPGINRSWWGALKFALTTPWLMFHPLRLTSDNRAVGGVNLAHLWDDIDVVREWVGVLLAWWEAGKLAVHVDRVFALEEAAEAHRYLQARQNVGKVVLRP